MGVAHEDHVTEVIGRGDEVAEAMQLLQGALRGSKEEREEERWYYSYMSRWQIQKSFIEGVGVRGDSNDHMQEYVRMCPSEASPSCVASGNIHT